MNEKIQAYKARLEKQLRTARGNLSRFQAAVTRLEIKLEDVEDSFTRELKRGAVKVSKIAGVEPDKKTKNVFKEEFRRFRCF